jgi:hypothetical protein
MLLAWFRFLQFHAGAIPIPRQGAGLFWCSTTLDPTNGHAHIFKKTAETHTPRTQNRAHDANHKPKLPTPPISIAKLATSTACIRDTPTKSKQLPLTIL